MRWQNERGIVLVVTLMAMVLLTAVGAALTLTTSVEALTASSFRGGVEALYAAEAAAEWATADLAAVVPDWTTAVDGSVRSGFVDGPPSGTRRLADGSFVDLSAVVGANPDWRPYGFGFLEGLLPASTQPSSLYVIVMVAADPDVPGRVKLRTESFGPRGAHKVLELTLSRSPSGVKFEAWQEVR